MSHLPIRFAALSFIALLSITPLPADPSPLANGKSALRNIAAAEVAFLSLHDRFGDLKELAAAGVLSEVFLADLPRLDAYEFLVTVDPHRFRVVGIPLTVELPVLAVNHTLHIQEMQ